MTVSAAPQAARAHRASGSGASIRLRDRSAEFRRAKRHSRLVAALKILLPLSAAGILSLYVLPSLLRVSVDGGRGTATVEAVSLEAGALKMVNPRVTGVHDKQGEYDLRASSATQQAANPDVLFLDAINGKMTNATGEITTIIAPAAEYNNRAEEMIFTDGVTLTRTPAMSAVFETAKVYIKEQRIVSETPVEVRLHDSTIRADRLTLYTADARAIFEGRVRVHLARQSPADGGSQSFDRESQANPANGSGRQAE
jgi:lipopolysaccharide export system protein LptC